MYRKVLILGVALGSLFLLVGCSKAAPSAGNAVAPPASSGAPSAGNAVVSITMDEWHMKPSFTSVPAGKVTIMAIATGVQDHEAVLIKSTKAANSLVVKSETGKVDEVAAGETVGEVEVEAGTTEAGTFNLAPGHYVVICNLKDHYKNGMSFDLTVTGTTAK